MNPIVQDLEICQYKEYYQGIINLNKAWVPALLRKRSTIPLYELHLGERLKEEQEKMPEMTDKKSATKSRILFLLRYLLENTDDEHALNTNDLIVMLEKNGFSANRKTVRDDIDMLCDAGFEILIDKEGKSNSYHYGSRTFELPELRMLVDAVSSSRFISAEKSDALINKLTSLTSKYEAESLAAKVFTADRIKADNGKIFLTTDVVSRAIEQEKKVSFQYYDYLPSKEKVLRNNGEVYIISPYALIWSDDRYYLVGYSDKRHELTPFRVDRMTVPQITDEPAVKNTSFNPADFANKVVQMYPSGNEQTVTLRCKNENMRSVIDKFGEDIKVDVIDTQHFTAKVQVQPSQTFFGWVFTFRGDIEIVGPDEVREEFFSIARKVLGE